MQNLFIFSNFSYPETQENQFFLINYSPFYHFNKHNWSSKFRYLRSLKNEVFVQRKTIKRNDLNHAILKLEESDKVN